MTHGIWHTAEPKDCPRFHKEHVLLMELNVCWRRSVQPVLAVPILYIPVLPHCSARMSSLTLCML